MYQIIVGNIGTVYSGNIHETAREAYGYYVRLSKELKGRAAGESVTWFHNDDIESEYVGTDDWIDGE